MSDFSGVPSVGLNNSIIRPAPEAPPPAIPSVEAGLKGKGLSGRMTQDARTPPEPQVFRRRGQGRADPQQLAGPSPAFQASVLELELDLQNTIARVEAARTKRELDRANGAMPEAGKTQPEQPEPAPARAEPPEPEVPAKPETADAPRPEGPVPQGDDMPFNGARAGDVSVANTG